MIVAAPRPPGTRPAYGFGTGVFKALAELQPDVRDRPDSDRSRCREVIAFVRRISDVEHPRSDLMLDRRVPLLRHRRRAVGLGDGNALAEQRAGTGGCARRLDVQAAGTLAELERAKPGADATYCVVVVVNNCVLPRNVRKKMLG